MGASRRNLLSDLNLILYYLEGLTILQSIVLHYLSPRSLQCLNSTLSTPILFSGFVSIILFFLITNVITAQRKYLDNDEETTLAFENRFTLKIGFYILKVFPRSSRDGRCVMLGGGWVEKKQWKISSLYDVSFMVMVKTCDQPLVF